MKRPSAMFLAGLFSTLFIIGSVFMAFQAGVFASATTTVQVNGDINVPEMKDKPATQDNTVPEVVFVTRTQVITQDPIVHTVYVTVTEENHQREAELLQQLNEAYRLMKERDAIYQAKLKEAYDRAQASAAKVPSNSSTTNQVVIDKTGSDKSNDNQTTDQQTGSGQTSGGQTGSGQTSSGQTNIGHTGGTQTGSTQTGTITSTLHIVPAKPVTQTHDGDVSELDWKINLDIGSIGGYSSTISSLQNIHDIFSRYTNTQQTISDQFVNLGYQNIGLPFNRTADPTDTLIISSTSPIAVNTVPTITRILTDASSPTPASAVLSNTSTSTDNGIPKTVNSVQTKTGAVQNNGNDHKDNGSTQNQKSDQQKADKQDNSGQQDQKSSQQNNDHEQQDGNNGQEQHRNQHNHD